MTFGSGFLTRAAVLSIGITALAASSASAQAAAAASAGGASDSIPSVGIPAFARQLAGKNVWITADGARLRGVVTALSDTGLVVVEDGARIFDLNDSKYSISGEYNKCGCIFWSAERNIVRRILDSEVRNGNLRLMVQQLGGSVVAAGRAEYGLSAEDRETFAEDGEALVEAVVAVREADRAPMRTSKRVLFGFDREDGYAYNIRVYGKTRAGVRLLPVKVGHR